MSAMIQAYPDDQRETFNSALRDDNLELCAKVASCACVPLRILEGVGMMVCGAALWPLPCTVCQIKTEKEGRTIINEGTRLSCSCCGLRPKDQPQNSTVTITLTGYQCLSSGIGKIVTTLFSAICCPLNSLALAHRMMRRSADQPPQIPDKV